MNLKPTEAITSDMVVICPACGETGTTSKRVVEGYKKVWEIGMMCDNCQQWSHSMYINNKLIAMRQKVLKLGYLYSVHPNPQIMLKGTKLERKFKREFDKFNTMMRLRMAKKQGES